MVRVQISTKDEIVNFASSNAGSDCYVPKQNKTKRNRNPDVEGLPNNGQ